MINNKSLQLLAAGLQALHLSLEPPYQKKLLQFLQLLEKWNRHYNLTAITEPTKMISHHLLDSLAVAPYIDGENILDLGTGAGFPGIPLAVYFPKKCWTLLDSNGKKTRFLIQAQAELSLPNVEVIQQRAEQWQPPQPFDMVVTRAVGSIETVLSQAQHLIRPEGQWLFMKSEPSSDYPEATIHRLQVPGVDGSRYAILLPALAKN